MLSKYRSGKIVTVSENNLKKLYRQSKIKIVKLEQAIEIRDKQLEEQGIQLEKQDTLMVKMAETIKKLEAALKRYDNPNTPPSKKFPKAKKTQPSRNHGPKRKQGGQKGHPGKTSKPKPTKFQEHKPEKCPDCSSENLEITDSIKRNITERRKIIKVTTTCHTIHTCKCLKCGRIDIAPDTTRIVPKNGSYGHGIVSDVLSSFESRMPIKMISKNSQRDTGIHLSTGAICNILYRVGSCLKTQTAQILASLYHAKMLHMDETSFKVNGKLFWVWIFFNPDTGESYYAIRKSRGSDVPKELLPNWKGIVICDGWQSYKIFGKIQRCWAHIIREALHLFERNPDSRAAKSLLQSLHRIYHDAKKKRKAREREAAHKLLTRRIKKLLTKYGNNPLLKKYIGKLERALPDMFRFVLDPRIPSTNNAAERELREIVIHRKIRGQLKSKNTTETLGNIFSCFTTWKNQGINHLAEMTNYL